VHINTATMVSTGRKVEPGETRLSSHLAQPTAEVEAASAQHRVPPRFCKPEKRKACEVL
jgi:hypothetical protein